jgi:hypothetical protein
LGVYLSETGIYLGAKDGIDVPAVYIHFDLGSHEFANVELYVGVIRH